MASSILDVAMKAGVSHTTVSRILRNAEGYTYAPATRQKVLAAARALAYVPNAAARFMRLKKTRLIGITTQTHNAYATYRLIEKISLCIRQLGYAAVMIDLSAPDSAAGGFLDITHLAGAICMYSKHEREMVGRCARLGRDLPIVTVRRKVTDNPSVHMVTSDNAAGLAKAFRHLQELGHRRIGYLGYHEPTSSRQSAYASLCRKAGLARQIFTVPVYAENNSFLSGMKMARTVAHHGRISAVLCEDDEFAAGLIAGLADLKLNVPGDISVVGFDDLPFATAVRPRLTTVGVKMDEKADTAARLLVALIEGNDVQRALLPGSIVLDAELIVRDSTACLSKKKCPTHAH